MTVRRAGAYTTSKGVRQWRED